MNQTAIILEKLTSPSAKLVEVSSSLPVPSLSLAILILPLSIIAAWLINRLLSLYLTTWGKKTPTQLDVGIISAIRHPMFWTITCIGLSLTLSAFHFFSPILPILQKIILSILILLWSQATIKILATILDEFQHAAKKQHHPIEPSILGFLKTIERLALLFLAGLIIFGIWGINLTPFIASAGILAAALSLGAKDAIANFVGGLTVLTDKPFTLGDTVSIQNNHQGKVVEIGLRSTKIQTFDRQRITVPNSIMANEVVVNQTGVDPLSRLEIELTVLPKSNLEKIEATLIKILESHPDVVTEPVPFVRFQDFTNSGIRLKAYAYIDRTNLKAKVKHELIKTIHQPTNQAHIKLAFNPGQNLNL